MLDVFSTYLYDGNGATQTITNGIDLAGKGGMVIIKGRNTPSGTSGWGGSPNQFLWQDTVRDITKTLISNGTGAQSVAGGFNSVSSSGFELAYNGFNDYNYSGNTYVSWTFRKAPKFFDVVTWTGDGSATRQINHSLGQEPGLVIGKKTSGSSNWGVWHRSIPGQILYLELSQAASSNSWFFPSSPTATTLNVGYTAGMGHQLNDVGQTYVAYLFAHDASADGIIQCGSFTTDGSGSANVDLGWEPQFLLHKSTSFAEDWWMRDSMRGFTSDIGSNSQLILRPNLTNIETSQSSFAITSRGFKVGSYPTNSTVVYMAIRRNNKIPTSGIQVYKSVLRSGTLATANVTGVGFSPDVVIGRSRSVNKSTRIVDKLRGAGTYLSTMSISSESTKTDGLTSFEMDGYKLGADASEDYFNGSLGESIITWCFKRAPGFMDVVAYTGTGSATTVSHGLGAVPEIIIVKSRNYGANWPVYHTGLGANYVNHLDEAIGKYGPNTTYFAATAPTSSVFSVGSGITNNSGINHIAYLFATLPGVSKVGSYTGDGSSVGTKIINCGFTSGARFILIKRIDADGDWYVWDSLRGIGSGIDPHISLIINSAENTTSDSIATSSLGFAVNQNATTNINVNGANYIFLAIA